MSTPPSVQLMTEAAVAAYIHEISVRHRAPEALRDGLRPTPPERDADSAPNG